jgi:hypothetical protein
VAAPKIPKTGGWANGPVKGTSTQKSKGGAGFDRSPRNTNSARSSGAGTHAAAHGKNVYGDRPKKGGGVRTGVARSVKAIHSLSKTNIGGASGAKSFISGYKSAMRGGGGRSYHRDAKGRFA